MGRAQLTHFIGQGDSGLVRRSQCTIALYVLPTPQVHRTRYDRVCRVIGFFRWTRRTGRDRWSRGITSGSWCRATIARLQRLEFFAILSSRIRVLQKRFTGEGKYEVGS